MFEYNFKDRDYVTVHGFNFYHKTYMTLMKKLNQCVVINM